MWGPPEDHPPTCERPLRPTTHLRTSPGLLGTCGPGVPTYPEHWRLCLPMHNKQQEGLMRAPTHGVLLLHCVCARPCVLLCRFLWW